MKVGERSELVIDMSAGCRVHLTIRRLLVLGRFLTTLALLNVCASAAFAHQSGAPAQRSLFADPLDVAIDPHGNVYVTDQLRVRLVKLSPTGHLLTQWGGQGSGPGQFNIPEGVVVGPEGNVYAADTWNSRIQKFSLLEADCRPCGRERK